ncbi:substrate-binding domain-containing protein [Siccirubricoccus sp. KC 17139]|uniref:Substrate-binding domain-containing protein n=1 Tax=Siccirubricoccus soli TaxID=2899147 RepID=A0ABT1D404_9PROT|nr:substrate-binding domain-containing protein [Siccirubricoccus soli]MCO6416651.1 substrate-binding domain-containing protein [Siccirubricoccus soli]MCP2682786.1 substrate-binding domain-containing protein [Siccirubricoccus soli]
MRMPVLARRALLAALLVAAPLLAQAAELVVMTSGGFDAALGKLAPQFEAATGHRITIVRGSSMGVSPTAIPARLQKGETADVVILAAPALDQLVAAGHVVPGSRTDLVESTIGMVVRAGAPRPDISTVEAFRRTLLEAKSIGYSASASGTYLSNELFARLGVAEQVMPKAVRVVTDRVASRVARGELEIGFQQVSELLPEPGTDFVGEIPRETQQVTIFAAGLAAKSQQPELARQLIAFLHGPEARPTIAATGLIPLPR